MQFGTIILRRLPSHDPNARKTLDMPHASLQSIKSNDLDPSASYHVLDHRGDIGSVGIEIEGFLSDDEDFGTAEGYGDLEEGLNVASFAYVGYDQVGGWTRRWGWSWGWCYGWSSFGWIHHDREGHYGSQVGFIGWGQWPNFCVAKVLRRFGLKILPVPTLTVRGRIVLCPPKIRHAKIENSQEARIDQKIYLIVIFSYRTSCYY